MRQAPAIGFECRISPILVAMMVAAAVLAIAAVWISGAPFWLRSGLSALVAGSGGTSLARLLRPRVRSVLWRVDGGVDLVVTDASGGHREVQGALQYARVMGPLIALTLRWPPRERATIWLLPDNLDSETGRRLRMRLGTDCAGLSSGNADSG